MCIGNNRKVFIILVNYGGFEITIDCICSLKKITNQEFQIVVVDNCSPDNSYEMLTKKYQSDKKVIVLKTSTNSGFAGGNNYGIKYALQQGAEYLILLNNDTEVESNFFDIILKEYDGKSIITPRINYYFDKQTPWYCAGEIDYNKCIVKNGNPEIRAKISFASGCCMLLSREIISNIGLMEESFFMYYEDVDYSLRARKAGIDIVYNPQAIIYHKVGKSSGGEKSKLSIYYNNRNRLLIMKKYHFGFLCYIYTYATRFLKLIYGCITDGNDKIIWKAFKDYKHGITGKISGV